LADEVLDTKSSFLAVVDGKAVTNTIPFYKSADWEIYSADGTFYFLAGNGELVAAGAWDFFEGKLCKSLSTEFLDRYEVEDGDRFHSRMPCGTITLTNENILTVVPEPAEDMIARGLDAITVSAQIEEPAVLREHELPSAADVADENLMQHFSNSDGAADR